MGTLTQLMRNPKSTATSGGYGPELGPSGSRHVSAFRARVGGGIAIVAHVVDESALPEGWTLARVRAIEPAAELLDPSAHYVVADERPASADYDVLKPTSSSASQACVSVRWPNRAAHPFGGWASWMSQTA